MATSTTNYATVSSATTSDWVHAYVQTEYRIDVDVDGFSGVTYTVQTTHNDSTGKAKTIVQPSDVTTNWSFSDSTTFLVPGNSFYRVNVSSVTGSGTVTISLRETKKLT